MQRNGFKRGPHVEKGWEPPGSNFQTLRSLTVGPEVCRSHPGDLDSQPDSGVTGVQAQVPTLPHGREGSPRALSPWLPLQDHFLSLSSSGLVCSSRAERCPLPHMRCNSVSASSTLSLPPTMPSPRLPTPVMSSIQPLRNLCRKFHL